MTTTPTLMSAGRIGSLELKNRIIMSPMGTNLAEADGHCSQRIVDHYEARAKGGAAMLIVGVGSITWPVGACNPNQVAISDDRFLPGLQQLTQSIKQHDCKAAIQLQHAGQVAICDITAGRPMLVPSVPPKKNSDMTNALTKDEMAQYVKSFVQENAKVEYHVASKADLQQLVDDFTNAAERAKHAGFDGVELHAGHGYILSSFISPFSNKRDDEYGGSLENRARLLLEVITAIRDKLGTDFPLWCRIDAQEYSTEGGISFNDAKALAPLIESAGIDAIHVSAYANSAKGIDFTRAPLVHEPSGFVKFATGIRQQVNIPVIAVGRIEPEVADKLLANKKVDFIAMGRKLLADPDLPRKLKESRPEDIRPCIYCYTCVSQIFLNKPVMCAVNPATGRDREFEMDKAATVKHVLVVGGGPAGMECARILTLRGHKVTLCEKSNRLGGTVFFASFVYEPNGKLIEYLQQQLRKLPIDIQLQQKVDLEYVNKLKPDAVVVAVGAKREAPAIKGADAGHVLSGDQLRQLMTGEDKQLVKDKLNLGQRTVFAAGSLLGITADADKVRTMSKLWMPLGDTVAIVGGGLVGIELAEFMIARGRKVTVLEESDKFATELSIVRRWRTLHEIKHDGVCLLANAKVLEINKSSITYEDNDGQHQKLAADNVVIAQGAVANHDLTQELAVTSQGASQSDKTLEIHSIGDCNGIGYIEGAILDAATVARTI